MPNAIALAQTEQRERILKAAVTAVYDRYCSTAIAELESAVVDLIGEPLPSEDDEDETPTPAPRLAGTDEASTIGEEAEKIVANLRPND